MILKNGHYTINIKKDTTYRLGSTDNHFYDLILNPLKLNHSDFHDALSIYINDGIREQHLALVGDLFSSAENIAILKGHDLIVLEGFSIIVIDCHTYKVTAQNNLKSAMCIAIYEFDDGYVVHGELEIIKLSSTFEVEWVFMGGEIFVRFDKECFLEIKGDKIHVIDWINMQYEIDKLGNGKVINTM